MITTKVARNTRHAVSVRTMRTRRGVALLLVLWLVVILATVAMAASGAARSSGDLVTGRRASATAQSMAQSGIVAAVAAIDDSLKAFRSDTVARDAYLNALDAGVNNGATSIGRARSDAFWLMGRLPQPLLMSPRDWT